MEVTWLVMRARSPGLQPLSVIQQDSLFPFCPDCIWAFSQVGIPWHIGTPLLVLDFLKTGVVLRVMVRWGMSWVCVLPAGVVGRLLQGVCCSAVAAVSASPCLQISTFLHSAFGVDFFCVTKMWPLWGIFLFLAVTPVAGPVASSQWVIKTGKRCLETLCVCFKFALCLRNKTVKQIHFKMTALRETRFS